MRQQRTAPSPIDWSRTPGTWIALAVALLAVSAPQWVAAVGQGKSLAYVVGTVVTAAAAVSALHGRRLLQARRG